MMWWWLFLVLGLFYIHFRVYTAGITRTHRFADTSTIPPWTHGDIVIIANHTRAFNPFQIVVRPLNLVLTGTNFVHPLIILGTGSTRRIMHLSGMIYTPHGDPLCPTPNRGAHVLTAELGYFLREHRKKNEVTIQRWEPPRGMTMPAEETFLRVGKEVCGTRFTILPEIFPGIHCIGFMTRTLHRLGLVGRGKTEAEVMAWAGPGRFQELLATSGYTKTQVWG